MTQDYSLLLRQYRPGWHTRSVRRASGFVLVGQSAK